MALLSGCDEQSYPSPNGSREVVISAGQDLDAIWTVSLKSPGLLGKPVDIGCFTDDDPATGVPTGIHWASDHEIVIAFSAWDDKTDEQVTGESRILLGPDGAVTDVIQPRPALQRPCLYS